MFDSLLVLAVGLILISLVLKYGMEGILEALMELAEMLLDLIGLEILTETLELLAIIGL